MKKITKRLVSAVCIASMALSVACNGNPGEIQTPPEPKPPTPDVNISTEHVEKDYVYLTYSQNDRKQNLYFQTPDYMLQIAAKDGRIAGFQPISYSEKYFVEQDFSKISGADTTFYVQTDNGSSEASGVQLIQNSKATPSERYWRLLEGGKYKQKADVPKLVYDKEDSLYGRLEVVAYQMNFRLKYDLFSTRRVANAVLSFDFTSEVYTQFSTALNGRVVTLLNEKKDGVAFILPEDGSVTASSVEKGVKFTAGAITITPKKLTGFAVNAVPVRGGDLSETEEVIARESIVSSVQRTMPETEEVTTLYEDSSGTLLIDGNMKSDKNWNASYTDASDFNAYDVFRIRLKNEGDRSVTYPVSVMFNNTLLNTAENVFGTYSRCNLIGNASFLRDRDGYPVGVPVQVSKNWHTYESNEVEAVARTFTGQWYVGTVYIEVPAGSEVEYEYVTVYAKWGDTESVSHSQLCLIGWDGYDLWEQLALGSYGESITYYVNGNGTSSWIQDIRPFRVTEYHGNNVKYSWSGNVGGAEFLRYEDSYERLRYVDNIRSDFRSQGPNMTETDTAGYTTDGKIHTEITSNLVRTDDVNRVYFTVNYTFVEDVDFMRMTLFQYNTNRYQQDYFQKYAYGNAEKIIRSEAQERYSQIYCEDSEPQQLDIAGENPWFYLYDFDFAQRAETSGAMYTVREYRADLNGKTYTAPTVNFRNANGQLTFELTTPKEVGRKIEKGSKIEMVIEFTVLPNKTENFYGVSDYMNATLDLFGTAEQGLQQAVGGNVAVSASVGEVISRYPVTVACDTSNGGTVAEFAIRGGLGYVPVKLTGLDRYNGYKLQVKEGDVWKDVDQSVKGNDFWQCGLDRASGKYYLIYNVKNTVGTAFNTENRYRLIER